jgi:hypothetical protein
MLIICFTSIAKTQTSNPKVIERVKKEHEEAIKNAYMGETFISEDYYFSKTDYLVNPACITYNPVTGEFIVVDSGGEKCLYLFNEAGKFIKKVGRLGQGPGEFTFPVYASVDNKGDIYVLDTQDGDKISIFSKEGKFIHSFRVNNVIGVTESIKFSFSLSEKQEIITSLPLGGYYISLLSRDGKLIKNIGKIDRIHKYEINTLTASHGRAFKGSDNLYYLFLPNLQIIRVYTEDGKKIKEYNLCDVIQTPEGKDKVPFEKRMPTNPEISQSILFAQILLDVQYRDNCFFVVPGISAKTKESFIVLDNNMSIIKKYNFGISFEMMGYMDQSRLSLRGWYFTVIQKEDRYEMFFPMKKEGEIIKYVFKK